MFSCYFIIILGVIGAIGGVIMVDTNSTLGFMTILTSILVICIGNIIRIHLINQEKTISNQEKIETNQRSLIIFLNEKISNGEKK